MFRVNIHEAKARLSRYLDRASRGERVVICRRNVPVAELRAVERARRTEPRPWGTERGRFRVPDDFNAPLPEDELASWEGDG